MHTKRSFASLSLLLKQYRSDNGLTQEDLAERAGISVRTLAALESGTLHMPRLATLRLLADAMDLPSEETHILLALRQITPSTVEYHAPPTNLPTAPTPLIGREQATAQAMHLLRQSHLRLLTVIGTAGVGKTRLALHVAHHVLDDFPDGVYLVELAALTHARMIPGAIAAAMTIREQGNASLARRLNESLRDKHLLVVLDNCEQITDAALYIADLLAACPSIKLLATSRSPLHLRGEHLLEVAPLDLPPLEPLPALTDLARNPAIALFVQRVQAINPHFTLTATNAQTVAELCVRLDGLPLALELAAARSRVFSLPEILARLHERFALLAANVRDLPERQQSLHAALDWSYTLLASADQDRFRRLAVFAGSASLEAIAAVCGGPVADTMLRLLDQSLVQRMPEAEPTRFTLLETVRAYAWEMLHAQQEDESARGNHAAAYLALAETAQANITTAQRALYAQQMDLDNENLHAAFEWYQAADAVEDGLRLAAALQWFWTMRGRFAEGRAWVETFLERDRLLGHPAEPTARARALSAAGRLAFNQSDYTQAAEYERAALDLFTQLHDLQHAALCWSGLGLIAEKQSHFDEANAAYQHALAAFTESNARFRMGTTLMNLGNVAFLRGAIGEAADYYERGVVLLRESSDPQALAMAQGNLASIWMERGDPERAIQIYHEILTIFRQLDDHVHLALTQRNLGYVYYQQGSLTEAEAVTTEALHGERQMHHQRGIAENLSQLGYIFCEQGRLDDAIAACSESLLLFAQIDSGRGIVAALLGLAKIVLLQGAPTEAVQLLAAAITHAQTLSMQIFPAQQVYAENVRTQAHTALGEAHYAAAWAIGIAWSTADAVAAVQRYLDA